MRVRLKALGCRLNEAELEGWARAFRGRGHHVVGEGEAADLVVLNSCAVTGEAARKSRQVIRRLHRELPAARLVVSGCYASLSPEDVRDALGVDLVVDNGDKDQLVEIAARELDLPVMPALASEPGEPALFARGRSRAFVKVQDGCRYRCTFCIVTVARGNEHSRPVADIVSEVNALHTAGIQEAVLTGVHVGGYGSDLGSSLYELLRTLLAETDIPRLRLASVEPWDLPEDFFALFSNSRLAPHMHLPLQSGADSVLRRMARRCRTAEFRALVEQARRAVPEFNVTTDVIVGFPGESDAEWRETLAFVESVGFGHLHIFSYSPRSGTKAARLPDQVGAEVKKARSRELHALARRLKQAHLEAQLGRVRPVLWEGSAEAHGAPHGSGQSALRRDAAARVYGYTPNFTRVAADMPGGAPAWGNRIHRARLVRVSPCGEFAEAELSGD